MSRDRYRVELAPAVRRQLRRLPPGDAARLRAPILALAIEPRPPGVTKLSGTDLWRLRLVDLRVIYQVDDAARLVIVLKVARRSESTYRRVDRRPRSPRSNAACQSDRAGELVYGSTPIENVAG